MVQDGKVAIPEEMKPEKEINAEKQVAKALKAFREQVYFLLVDGQQFMDLDSEIELKADSKIFFLRMLPLQGG